MAQPATTPKLAALRSLLPGLSLCLAIAALAVWLGEIPFVKDRLHLGALLLVIVLGMLWKTILPPPAWALPGIDAAQRPLLRAGVALLGFKLSLSGLASVGWQALVVVLVSTTAALAFGWWLADRMGLPHKLGLLLGVGTAVCGASAIVAAESVVQGERKDVAASLGVITLLGTVGILVYPLVAKLTGMPQFLYGVWDGASLHEMAQVVAAGSAVGDEALRVATVVKLARIAMLAPIVLFLAWTMRRHGEESGDAKVAPVPWFLVLFVVFVAINSFVRLPESVLGWLNGAGLWVLAIGMAGVGLQTGFSDVKEAGGRAVLVGLLQWLFLAALSFGLAYLLIR